MNGNASPARSLSKTSCRSVKEVWTCLSELRADEPASRIDVCDRVRCWSAARSQHRHCGAGRPRRRRSACVIRISRCSVTWTSPRRSARLRMRMGAAASTTIKRARARSCARSADCRRPRRPLLPCMPTTTIRAVTRPPAPVSRARPRPLTTTDPKPRTRMITPAKADSQRDTRPANPAHPRTVTDPLRMLISPRRPDEQLTRSSAAC